MASRWPFPLIFVGVLAVVFVGGTVTASVLAGHGWGPAFGISIALAASAAVVLVIVLASSAYNNARIRHVRALRPDSEAFTATRVDGFGDGLVGAAQSGVGVGTAFAVTLGPRGIELWRNATREAPAYTVEWSDVAAITVGEGVIRNRRGPAVTAPALLVSRRGGAVLPLTVARDDLSSPASQDAVDALAKRLQARIRA